jgi:UrcA family protein
MAKTLFTLTAAALGAAALSLSPAAYAAAPSVSWKDLDLSTDAGKAALDTRVEAAAQAICTPQVTTGTIINRAPSARCVADASEQIKARIASREQALRLARQSHAGGATVASAR